MRKLNFLICLCLALFAYSASAQDGFWLPRDANGWSVITESPDTRKVYVSNSGDDANDGLSPATPKATIAAASELIRDGYPDWLLLKRGDTFAQTGFDNIGARRWKSGRSASEPLVMSYYGDSGPRPVIKLTSEFIDWNGKARSHVAFVGLDLYRSISDPDSEDFNNSSCGSGFRLLPGNGTGSGAPATAAATNILIEDCVLRFCEITVQAYDDIRPQNVVIRRNVVSYVWAHGSTTSFDSRPSGSYIDGVDNLVMEENIYHHNGFSLKIPGAGANMYSHNVYLQSSLGGTTLVRGNIISHGAAHGVQLRSGGKAVMNAFVGNAVGMNIGYSSPPTHYSGLTTVDDNVATDGRPMIPNKFSAPQTGALWGIQKAQHIPGPLTVNNNIVANIKDNRGSNVTHYADFPNLNTTDGSQNIGWNWGGGASIPPTADPAWTDPDRNADKYAQEIAGLGSWKNFIDAAINRPVGQMPLNLTAYAYVNYIREGFDKAPVTPPYPNYTDCQGNAVTGISLAQSEVTLVEPGDTKELVAAFLPSDACNRGLTWSSNNEAVATVDGDGVVTAGATTGQATITVTTVEGTFTASVTVNVTGTVAVTGVELTPNSLSLGLGETQALTATVLPANATHKDLTWTSNNPAVATVNNAGVVVGVSSGTARITVTTVEGSFSQECDVTVTGQGAYLLDGVNNAYIGQGSQRNHPNVVRGPEGTGVRSVYTYKPGVPMPAPSGGSWPASYGGWSYWTSDATSAYHDFAYSSNTEVYFQNNEGGTMRSLIYWPMPSSVPLNKLTLSARLGGGSATNSAFTHFIVKSGSNIYISAASEGGHSKVFTLDATSTDWYLWDFAANDGNNFNPVLQNPVSAGSQTIDAIGVFITGQTNRNSMILRGLKQVMYTFEDFDAVAVTGVSVAPSVLSLTEGGTGQLTASVVPADATNAGISWTSSDESVATVDASGLVTAVGAGGAEITATTHDGGFTATSEVTVGAPEEHYLLDAINTVYVGGGGQRSKSTQGPEGNDFRSIYAFQPGVPMPAPSGSTWPVTYGGWNFLSHNVASAYHEFSYHNLGDGGEGLLFQNDKPGTLRTLTYWPIPSPAPLNKLGLSVTYSGYFSNASTHFVVKSGNNYYISAAHESAQNSVFELDAASTVWYPWDFAANGGNNFDPVLENPVSAGNQAIDAIGIFIAAESASTMMLRVLKQVKYTVEGTTLPVKLAHFTAEKENGTAQLRWSTAEETNSSHFEVQHSRDAKSWARLAEVASGRESTTLSNYHYAHASPENGFNYYRLKMVDRDGTYEFSPVRSVAINKAENIISIYPNPVTGRFLLKNVTEPIRKVEIYNLAGNRVVSLASVPSEGVDVSGLAEGLYVVKIEKHDGTVVNSRIVVQK